MPSKKFDMEKTLAMKTLGKLAQSGTAARFGTGAAALPDRREQRRLDQAAGLLPFATKLPAGLVAAINEAAQVAGLTPGAWLARELPARLPGYHAANHTQEG